MTGEVLIKQFQIADREDLLCFLEKAYPSEPRKSDRAFWEWHFLENPNTQPNNIPLWVAKDNAEIVGQLAAIPIKFKAGEHETLALWMLDLIVRSDLRGKGIGKQLFVAAEEYCPTLMALGFNEMSGPVLRSRKWIFIGGLHRYHKLLFPGNAYDEIAKYKTARNIVNFISAPLRSSIRRRTRYENLSVHNIANFDASFDDLWNRASSQWRCAVVRDQGYLEWQFLKQPGKKFEILGAYEDGRLVGYVVLYFRKSAYGDAPPKVAITDIVYDASNSFDVIDVLLQAAIDRAVEKEAGSVVIDILDEKVEKKLRDLGFWRIKSAPQFMATTNENESLIYDDANWFLTRADSDVSIFEHPNL